MCFSIFSLLYPGYKRRITGVTTQGRAFKSQWVTSYTMAHGNDPSQLQMYRERTGQDKVIWRRLDNAANFGYANKRLQEILTHLVPLHACYNPKCNISPKYNTNVVKYYHISSKNKCSMPHTNIVTISGSYMI